METQLVDDEILPLMSELGIGFWEYAKELDRLKLDETVLLWLGLESDRGVMTLQEFGSSFISEDREVFEQRWAEFNGGQQEKLDVSITVHDVSNTKIRRLRIIGCEGFAGNGAEIKIGIMRDDTLTATLKRSNEDLSDFAHLACHDLQEPLRKVQIYLNRVQQKLAPATFQETQVYFGKIMDACARMEQMVEGVLAYASHEDFPMDDDGVQLDEVVLTACKDLELVIAQKNALVVMHSQLPKVRGSSTLLRQLMCNLISNSLKFAKKDAIPLIHLRGEVEGSLATIELRDNGIGFSGTQNDRIFNSFVRLHDRKNYEGTGMGLAFCKKIVDRHGGKIKAFGVPGEGARFVIQLPVFDTTIAR